MAKPKTLKPEQLAPHSVEAEQAVLGAILINPDALFEVIPFLTPADFFIVRYGWIYEAMISLHERREPVDYLTIATELEQVGRLEESGGAAGLVALINKTPSSLNTEGYGRIVHHMSMRRQLIDVARTIARAAHSEETDISVVLGQSEEALFAVTREHKIESTATLRELASQIMDETFAAQRGDVTLSIPTRIRDLDTLIGGLRAGDLIIVAARPGMGKSSMLESIASANAADGVPVAFLSLEMGREQITRRIVAAESQIPYLRLLSGEIRANEQARYLDAMQRIATWPMVVDDSTDVTPMDVRTKVRRFLIEHGVQLVVIDYVQLMHGGPKFAKSDNRVQEMSFISRHLKLIAREMQVSVLIAAQLSRAVEQRTDKHPMLSDLRESGSLEQDADLIIFPYRDSYYSKDENDNATEIHVAKHRHGPPGRIEAIFLPEQMRFADAFHMPTNGDKQHEQVGF